MRKKGSVGKTGKFVKCPKCKYKWRTKQSGYYICCSMCKKCFKGGNINAKK